MVGLGLGASAPRVCRSRRQPAGFGAGSDAEARLWRRVEINPVTITLLYSWQARRKPQCVFWCVRGFFFFFFHTGKQIS